jgi:hypothetical protein
VLQGHGEPKTRLSFPGLIMGLIKDTHMRMPSDFHEEIKNPINDTFISRWIWSDKDKGKGKSKKASSSQAPPSQPTADFDFASYAQWQHQSNMHNWRMLEATNRANMYFQQSQYLMQQQSGYHSEIMDQFMTPPASYVNWPEGMPGPYGGGGDFAGHEDANMEEDVGDGNEQDDPELVHSATSTHHGSDDDDMQG